MPACLSLPPPKLGNHGSPQLMLRRNSRGPELNLGLNRATLAYVALTFLLPTLVFVVLKQMFGLQGPSINADFLLLGIAAAIGAAWHRKTFLFILVVGIFIIMLIHIGIGVGAVYIDDISLVRDYFQFIRYWPWREISFWTALGVAGMGVLYAALLRIDCRKVRVLPIVALLAAFIAVDFVGDTRLGHEFIPDNVLTSSANRTFKLIRKWQTSPGFTATPIAEPMMAHRIAMGGAPADRILSVAVEAYGLADTAAFNRVITDPMEQIVAPRYTVRIGTHAAKGGTLTGELRELCNLKTAGTPNAEERARIAPDCLPRLLREEGYRTLGIHGNSGFFYNRREVYPAIGFEKTLFYDDFLKADPKTRRCKTRAFDGICDEATFGAALGFLGGEGRRFAHVMTLDTHFPLDAMVPADRKCDLVSGLTDEDLCIYAHRMRDVLTTLGRQLATVPNPPDLVFVYGDHPPPYMTKDERAYFNRDAVPFIVLTRKR